MKQRLWGGVVIALAALVAAPAFADTQPAAPYWSVQLKRDASRPKAVKSLQPLAGLPYARAEKRRSGYLVRIGAWATRAQAEAAAAEFKAKYGAGVKVLQLENPVDWVLPSGGTLAKGSKESAPAATAAGPEAAAEPAPAAQAPSAPGQFASDAPASPETPPAEPRAASWSWDGPIGYPGDTWGRVTQDLFGESGLGLSTFVSQGVDWFKLPGDITFNTYAEYRYSQRTKDNRYFDSDGPVLGFAFVRRPFRLGAEYIWEKQRALDGAKRGRIGRAYLNWYTDWYKYMRRHGSDDDGYQILGLTGSTWGKVVQDRDGTAISGFVNEGIDWFTLPWDDDATFNTYAELRFGFRSKNATYFNSVAPAIGAEIVRKPFRFGMDYSWDYYFKLKEADPQWRLYLVWYYNWDWKYGLRNPFE